jgi:beta-lactamase regulating signal transducer with metallopeptidase domain/Leucine-rich repeat (LRR) protein
MSMLSWLADESFSTKLTIALLHFVWQGCCGGVLVISSAVLLRRKSARLRYALNVAVMLLMAFCLPVTYLVLEPPEARVREPTLQMTHRRAAPSGPLDKSRLVSTLSGSATVPAVAEPAEIASQAAVHGQPGRTPEYSSHSPTTAGPALSLPNADVFQLFSARIAALYLAGVALMLGRLLNGVWGNRRLRRSAVVIQDESVLKTVRALARRLSLEAAPIVAWCEHVTVPVVVGIVWPMILLPVLVVGGMSPDQLEAVLLHELIHLRRLDPIVNLFQRIIEAVLFFHPVIWLISHRISVERERAADDMVLAAGWDRTAYADALVRMAELSWAYWGRGVAPQAVAVQATGTSPTEFKLRVLRLLGDSRQSELRFSQAGMLAALLVVALAASIACARTDAPHWTSESNDTSGKRRSRQLLAVVDTPGTASRSNNQLAATFASDTQPAADASHQIREAKETAAVKEIEKLGGRCFPDDYRSITRVFYRGSQGRPFVDQDIPLLKSLPHLTDLDLGGTLCTDAGMKEVATLASLKKFTFHNSWQITDTGLKEIAGIKDLTELSFTGCPKITDAGVQSLRGNTSLRMLGLGGTAITDAALKTIGSLRQLTQLSLSNTKITDAGVRELANLKNLVLLDVPNTKITDASLKELSSFNKLRRLYISGTALTDAGVRSLWVALPNLEIRPELPSSLWRPRTAPPAHESADEATAIQSIKPLRAVITTDGYAPDHPVTAIAFGRASQFDDNDVPVFKSFKRLAKLSLRHTLITDAGLKDLSHLPDLAELTLDRTRITDAGLTSISQLTNLKTLSLHGCRITDTGLKEIGKLANLIELNLDGCSQITDAGISHLLSLKKLRKIHLGNTAITDKGVDVLCHLENLTSIGLGGNPALSFKLADASAESLSHLPKLTSLSLWSKRVTDEGVRHLARLKTLNSLNLQMTQMTAVGAGELARLENLKFLTVVGPRIDDAALKEISGLHNLEYLLVAGREVTDEGVEALRKLKGLQRLTVSSSKVTDKGARSLEDLHGLKSLDLGGCRQVTEEAIAALRKGLPHTQIEAPRKRPSRLPS